MTGYSQWAIVPFFVMKIHFILAYMTYMYYYISYNIT